jgi:hypothetical protein
LNCISNDIEEKKQLRDFVKWILNIGGGKRSDDGDELIQIPKDLLLKRG